MDPIYQSKKKLRNLFQNYRIYEDRIEIGSRVVLKTFKLTREDINNIEIRPPVIIGDVIRRRYSFFTHLRTLKVDFADFHRHVVIEKKKGFLKQLRITPDDPDLFLEKCQKIFNK